jgi:aminoglycoside phosphotransferase (APT) family kinase protein
VPQQHVVDIALLGTVAHRVFPGARSVSVEPASPGRLLVVYRLRADGVIYYLRVAEEGGEDLTTDAQVLARLAGLGVRVPAVVHVEAQPGDLDRSFLIVSAVAGRSLASHGTDEQARRAVRAAGRDAALINAIEVEGFGWLRRDGLPGLRAELARYADFVASDLPGRWPGWLAGVFSAAELDALQAVADHERQRPIPQAHLAHGDFDATHIWLDDHGRYAGIIDFGEVRGADRHFDLGHFLLHDRAARPVALFEDFLGGYAEAAALAEDHRDLIWRSAIMSGLRQLSLWLGPGRNDSPASDRARLRATQLRNLLAGSPPTAST